MTKQTEALKLEQVSTGYAHWEERIKSLMQQVGMPNSISLAQAMQQLVNEMTQATLPVQPAQEQRQPLTTMQPLIDVSNVVRFKPNAIVSHLLNTHQTCDMDALRRMDFTDEDRMQFAQLIGYSLSGYSELSYVSDESYEAAVKAARIGAKP